jgi:hypothetical protein
VGRDVCGATSTETAVLSQPAVGANGAGALVDACVAALLQESPLSYYSPPVQQSPPGIILLKQTKSPFKWRRFEPTITLLCVRWYCHSSLSYCDLEEMMRQLGLSVDRTTVWGWDQRYATRD